eukprot:TRINITY_DN2338_c0_g1_i1.p1 TRINITY_DN2338_c0_g1~~TRINITY_DN2338_c0_g1_i1.p1  ORF type:complete len:130 (+),score=33.03 TRINITY_DN2338_c0_g1_i1:379-768(+)
MRVLKERDGFYLVRVMSDQGVLYETSFPSRCMNGDLKDVLVVSVNSEGVVGFGYRVRDVVLDCRKGGYSDVKEGNWNTVVEFDVAVDGPSPLELPKQEETKEEKKDERGFLAKYWMYLLIPFALLLFLQ